MLSLLRAAARDGGGGAPGGFGANGGRTVPGGKGGGDGLGEDLGGLIGGNSTIGTMLLQAGMVEQW